MTAPRRARARGGRSAGDGEAGGWTEEHTRESKGRGGAWTEERQKSLRAPDQRGKAPLPWRPGGERESRARERDKHSARAGLAERRWAQERPHEAQRREKQSGGGR